ncbi:hypothetical protein [Rhodococcus sp. (in: high G+C Gram-positive bacteria)]|uniref:hypothetical protein n=1 Tax=Rhodococcus sp. TaxID=1831 RepID=UPI00331608E0
MIDFLNSSAGIYLLYSLAGVFQLFGIVIVVREFLRARRNDQLLQRNLQVIWKVWNEIDEDSGPLSVEYAGGDESFAAMIRPSVETDMRVRNVRLALEQVIGHREAMKEPNKWLERTGLLGLVLGIVLGLAASLFSVT